MNDVIFLLFICQSNLFMLFLAPDDGDSTDMLPIILGCVFGGLLLIVLIVVACLLCTKQTKFRKVSPEPVPMAGCKLKLHIYFTLKMVHFFWILGRLFSLP